MKVSKTFLVVVHAMFLLILFIVGMNNNYLNLNKFLCLVCYENSMALITLFFGATTFSLMRLFYGSILNKYIVMIQGC